MKILVLTSVYPSLESVLGFTPVVHYFAKEWVKQGHDVKIIHHQTQFPFFFYWLPTFLQNHFESKFGFKFPERKMITNKEYILDGVPVHRMLMYRIFPFAKFSATVIKKQIHKILLLNAKGHFIPDVILSHWSYPQLPIMIKLKEEYNCPCSLVLHGVDIKYLPENLIKNLDAVGFRSMPIKNTFLNVSKVIPKKIFMCYSGIKDEYFSKTHSHSFNVFTKRLLYVGALIKRKHVDSIIRMLPSVYDQDCDYLLEIVGYGPEENNLKTLVKDMHLSSKVHFLNKIDRDQVLVKMQENECFIMISSHETFGLVYLEAMSQGCIVIASKNEGIDGIIVNGINGFLCHAGNNNELGEIIIHINQLSIEERKKISQNAIQTATSLKESTVAYNYLQSVLN
jgi:glycosyltransferase involved in cell wall biosynthesis